MPWLLEIDDDVDDEAEYEDELRTVDVVPVGMVWLETLLESEL